MLGRLILLFLLTPAIELGLLIQVDKLIGFWPTIGVILVTGMAGSYLARREGLSTWKRLNERLNEGDLPGKELVDGVIILVAGALLITPGVLTDVLGFMGLLPPTRYVIRKIVMKRIKKKMREGALQMQFGMFGEPAPGQTPGSWSPPPPADGESNGSTPWQGTKKEVPDHASDESDASSSRRRSRSADDDRG